MSDEGSALRVRTLTTTLQRLPKSSETSEVWPPSYAESPGILAPKGLDSIAQGGSPGNTWPPQPIKAQRAVTRWRSRVTARGALRKVWLPISQGCALGFRVRPRGGRGAKTCVEWRPHSFRSLRRLRKSGRSLPSPVDQPSTINHQPSTINPQPSTINHQPSTINLPLPPHAITSSPSSRLSSTATSSKAC